MNDPFRFGVRSGERKRDSDCERKEKDRDGRFVDWACTSLNCHFRMIQL